MLRRVCATGCNVYPNQEMDRLSGTLAPGSQIFVTPGQRWKVGTRYVIQFKDGAGGAPLYFGTMNAIFWVYEDLLE